MGKGTVSKKAPSTKEQTEPEITQKAVEDGGGSKEPGDRDYSSKLRRS